MTLANGNSKRSSDSAVGITMTSTSDEGSPRDTGNASPKFTSSPAPARPALVAKHSYQTDSTKNAAGNSLRPSSSLRRPERERPAPRVVPSPQLRHLSSNSLSRSASSASRDPAGRPHLAPHSMADSAAPVFRSPFGAGYIANSSRGVEVASISSGRMRSQASRHSRQGEDQAGLDLSKTTAENELITGLGIRGSASSHTRSISDLDKGKAPMRLSYHSQTHSVGNSILGDDFSMSFKSTTSFVHPMRQQPRTYHTPAASIRSRRSQNMRSTVNFDDEVEPIAENKTRDTWQPQRPESKLSSRLPYEDVAPDEHSHAEDTVGALTNLYDITQSSASLRKSESISSLRSIGLARRRTSNTELPTSPTSRRTSVDKALGFLTRPSEPEDPAVRRASIVAARRAFEEKELAKERKRQEAEDRARAKMEDRLQRRGSELDIALAVPVRRGSEAVTALPTLDQRPRAVDSPMTEKMHLPYQYSAKVEGPRNLVDMEDEIDFDDKGDAAAAADAPAHVQLSKTKVAKGKLLKLTTWGKTRMLSVK